MASHGGRAAGSDQKNGFPRRAAGSGRTLRPGLGGNNEGYGFPTSAPLYGMLKEGIYSRAWWITGLTP